MLQFPAVGVAVGVGVGVAVNFVVGPGVNTPLGFTNGQRVYNYLVQVLVLATGACVGVAVGSRVEIADAIVVLRSWFTSWINWWCKSWYVS